MKEEIINLVREKKLLLEKQLFDILNNFDDKELAKDFLEGLEKASGQKVITVSNLSKNFSYLQKAVNNLNGETKENVERFFIKLGVTLEITRESKVSVKNEVPKQDLDYKIFYADTGKGKKIEVKDFVGHFRARYQSIQRILMQRPEMQNLVSIGKLSNERQPVIMIGIVSGKRVTKNKNIIVTIEDLTGEVNVLVKFDNQELFAKADELMLDDVIAVKGAGNREFIFAQDIFWPDAFLPDKVRFNEDFNIVFISDIHTGSDRHLGKSFKKFLDWLNSSDENAKKVKYLFIVGDNVDGVGVFPGQENVLKLKSMKEQYSLLTSYLSQVPKHITMFMCPGQHDATRVAEPQPIIGRKYAEGLYGLDNLILVTNPSMVKLVEGDKEFKILMYHGASIHHFINEIKELREMKAHRCPAKAVKHMLKRRHLAPAHGEVVYIPNSEEDPLVIKEVPDILCTGEVHRMDIESYHGVTIITGSCWQAQTDFEEKIGNIPDPAKVCMINAKTRELKLLDFLDEGEAEEFK